MIRPNAPTATKLLAARLEKKLDARLIAYATAACAAGVGMMAQSAEAKIVYTKANAAIGLNQSVNIDLNNDEVPDFSLYFGFYQGARQPLGGFTSRLAAYPAQAANEVWGVQTARGWECAAALPAGVKVGRGAPFQTGGLALVEVNGSYTRGATEHCPWNDQHRGAFLGLKFVVNGLTHYGWAHVEFDVSTNNWVLNGYAYETIPNQAIPTGKTIGPVAELDVPTLRAPQSATLGALAQGARGLEIWRRPEEQQA